MDNYYLRSLNFKIYICVFRCKPVLIGRCDFLRLEFTSLSRRTNRILVKAQGRDQARENLSDKAVHWLSSLGEVCFQPMTEPCSPSQCLCYNAINFCFRKVRIIHNSPRFPPDIRTSQFHGAAYFTTRPIHQ